MRRTVLLVLVVALLVLAGCGGETGSTDDDPVPSADDLSGADDEEGADEADDDETEDSNETGDENDGATGDAPSGDSDGTDDDGEEAADEAGTDDAEGTLEIHHIDVGQADATLVVAPSGETMLVDTGDWRQDGAGVIAYLEARDIDRIDHLVATHAHADHIGGHAAVIEHLETEGDGVGAAYDSGVVHTSQTYGNYLDAIEAHDVPLYEVREGDDLSVGDARVAFYNPPAGDSGDDLHYNSVALTVAFGEVTYLTTGDAEADAEARMVDAHGDDLEADVYQAGHHGSSTSSSDPFLDAAAPEVAVISSAAESQYGHPHDEVLESFDDREVETYWTAVHGDVVVTTDGETVTVDPAREGPTDGRELAAEKPDDEASASLYRPSIDVAAPRTAG